MATQRRFLNPDSTRGTLPLLVLVLGAALLLPACGYRLGGGFGDTPRTVSVPVFENHTGVPGLGADLSEAVVKAVQTRTPHRVAGAGAASTRLEGTVRRAEQRLLSRTPDASLPQEVEVLIMIDVAWLDNGTGDVLASARNLQQVGRFIPPAAVGERVEVADRQAVDRLASDIVGLMREGWGELDLDAAAAP